MRSALVLALIGSVALVGCGSKTNHPSDAAGIDAAPAARDAGESLDVGATKDGTVIEDSGTLADSGTAEDSGTLADSGTAEDSGTLADSGTTIQDAAPPDAAAAIDASAPDASDTMPPETTIDSAPAALTRNGTVTFTFSSSELGSTFLCARDGAATASCSSPLSYFAGEGAHTFAVAAVDAANNQDPTPAMASFTVDSIAPAVTIDSGPSATTTVTDAIFTFTASEPSTFACKLDSATAAPCTSPQQYMMVPTGMHTFTVTATDTAGNTGAPASRSFMIISPTPQTTITHAPPPLTNNALVTFQFTSDIAGATFQCRIDNAAFATCTSPFSQTVGQGAHTFAVRATAAGITDPTPATASFTVDTIAPTVTVTSPTQNMTTGPNVTVSYTTEVGATIECEIDPAAFATCPATSTMYMGLSNGSHTFQIRATDAANNTSAPVARTFTVDAIGPTVTITPLPGNVSPLSGHIDFTANETATFTCTIDTVAHACNASGVNFILTPGSHTLVVHGTDSFGNVGPNASYVFTAGINTTISVVNRGCSVGFMGATLVVQSPTGAVRGTATTDSSGAATTNLISDGDTITAAYMDGGDTRLETVYAVKAGEALTIGEGTLCLTIGTGFTVTMPGALSGATYYEVRYGECVRSFTAAELTTPQAVTGFNECLGSNGMYTLVARGSGSGGVFEESYLLNVSPGAMVTMPAWAPLQTIPSTLLNSPAGISYVQVEISARVNGIAVQTTQSDGDALNPALPKLPPGLGDTYRVYGEARFDAPNIQMFTGLGFDTAPAPTISIDLANVLPVMRSVTANRTNQSRPSFTYTSDAPIVADGGILFFEWTTPARGRWRLVFPSTMTPIVAPALPASLSAWLPTSASVYTTYLEHSNPDAITGWDQMRPVYRDHLDGYAEESTYDTNLPNTRQTSITAF